MRVAKVFSENIFVGILTKNDDNSYTFRYEDKYFHSKNCKSISLTLLKTEQEHKSEVLFPYFVNMLSEGINLKKQAIHYNCPEDDYFSLLLKTAKIDTIGATTIEEIL